MTKNTLFYYTIIDNNLDDPLLKKGKWHCNGYWITFGYYFYEQTSSPVRTPSCWMTPIDKRNCRGTADALLVFGDKYFLFIDPYRQT